MEVPESEYMNILNAHTFKDNAPFPEEDLRAMVDAVRIHDAQMLLQRNQNGGELQAYLENLKKFLVENNMLDKDFQPQEIFNNSAIVEALSRP